MPDAHYSYRCRSCDKSYEAEYIEKNLYYLCPDCGTTEKNSPLEGVLTISYDYAAQSRQIERQNFLKLPSGKPWLYPGLWPLRPAGEIGWTGISTPRLENLSLPQNQLVNFQIDDEEIFIFDESRNPTFSYKDRASIPVAIKAIQLGYSDISVASTGNAGSSLAGICARLNLKAHVWVPEHIPAAKLLQILAYGAEVHIVMGSYDTAFDLSLEVAQKKGWYNRNTAYNPLTIEGKKSAVFDLFLACGGILPERIFIPVGDGVILGGFYKGLLDLADLGWIDRLPQLFAVQAEGSDALKRFLASGRFEFREATTIADSICAGAPRNLFMAADAIKATAGSVVTVTDNEMLDAQKISAYSWGLLIEPSAAATLAAFKKLKKHGESDSRGRTLLLFTGNGLKDTNSLEKWTKRPVALGHTEWRQRYALNK